MIQTINDSEKGASVRSKLNAAITQLNTPTSGISMPVTRQVYLVGNATDMAALGGNAAQIYSTAQSAYVAAQNIRALLGANQVVAIMVGATVTTNINGAYTTTVGGITLSADWDSGVILVGVHPKVSVIDFINGSNGSGNAFNITATVANMRIGASASGFSISTRALGTSGNSGAMTLRLSNSILHGGLISDITNPSNVTGNGGNINISNLNSIVNSDIVSPVVIDNQITTSAKLGGSGTSGSLTLTGTYHIFGNITTANGTAGGGISIGSFTSFNYVFGTITLNTTSTSGVTFGVTNTICSGTISVTVPGGPACSADRSTFVALTVLNNGTGVTVATFNSCEINGLYTSNPATTTLVTMGILAGIAGLGNNSVLSLVSMNAPIGSPAINGIGTGCSILNSSIQGGSLSIDAASSRTVNIRNTTLINSVGSNITIKSTDAPQVLTDAPTVVWNMDLGFNAKLVIGGNRTLSITNLKPGQYGTIKVVQDATGGRTLTLPATSKVANAGGGVLTLSTGANAIDTVTFYYDGAEYIWTISLNAT